MTCQNKMPVRGDILRPPQVFPLHTLVKCNQCDVEIPCATTVGPRERTHSNWNQTVEGCHPLANGRGSPCSRRHLYKTVHFSLLAYQHTHMLLAKFVNSNYIGQGR